MKEKGLKNKEKREKHDGKKAKEKKNKYKN